MKLKLQLLAAAWLLLGAMSFAQPTAKLQVIHNSPTPTVDIYVNGQLLLNDFKFRTATPFIDVPANVQLDVAIAPANSTSASQALARYPAKLKPRRSYIAMAQGVLGSSQTPFFVGYYDFGREKANNDSNVGLAFFHGSPDAPAVDIRTGTSILFGNVSYGNFANGRRPYSFVPANTTYRLDVTPAGQPNTVVASYDADVRSLAGKSAIVMASGFLSGGAAPFEPWVVLPDGKTFPLPVAPKEATLQVIHNSPSPTVDIYVNGNLLLNDFAFRKATPYIKVPAGVTLNIGVALSNSTSVSDVIANFPVVLDAGKTYVAIANGVVGNTQTPFTIAVSNLGRSSAANRDNADINFFHGSPDAPAVNILANWNTIFSNVAFGKFGNYVSVPYNAVYRIGVAASSAPNRVIAEYFADVSSLRGKTAIVMATGFLGGGDTPFEPWVVTSDGATFPLPTTYHFRNQENLYALRANNKVTVNTDFAITPNPASSRFNVNFSLNEDSPVDIQIINLSGQVVSNMRLGTLNRGQQRIDIDANDLRNGYYIVRLESNEGIFNKKLVINK